MNMPPDCHDHMEIQPEHLLLALLTRKTAWSEDCLNGWVKIPIRLLKN